MTKRGAGWGRAAALTAAALCALPLPAAAPAAPEVPAAAEAREQPAAPATASASPDAKEAESAAPSLPFTGADALALVALTLSLLAAGFALRRFSTR